MTSESQALISSSDHSFQLGSPTEAVCSHLQVDGTSGSAHPASTWTAISCHSAGSAQQDHAFMYTMPILAGSSGEVVPRQCSPGLAASGQGLDFTNSKPSRVWERARHPEHSCIFRKHQNPHKTYSIIKVLSYLHANTYM